MCVSNILIAAERDFAITWQQVMKTEFTFWLFDTVQQQKEDFVVFNSGFSINCGLMF